MREHPARDRPALGLAAQRKRRLEIPHRQAPVRPVDPVEGPADERPERQDRPHREQAHAGHDADDREVLDAMAERRRLFSQRGLAREPERRLSHCLGPEVAGAGERAGQPAAELRQWIRLHCKGHPPDRHRKRPERQQAHVVLLRRQHPNRAGRPRVADDPVQVAARIAVVVAKPARPGEVVPGRAQSVEEVLRPGDAGERQTTAGCPLPSSGASNCDRPHRPAHAEDLERRMSRPRAEREHALVGGEHGVGREQRVGRLAQPAARQRPGVGLEILTRDDHQIDVPIELQVLKPVVEDVHRRAEVMFGQTAGQVAIARRQDRNARQLPRQHQRLVAGAIEIGADAVGVAHDDHAVLSPPAPVAAAQDGRPLPHVQELARQARDGRRLAAAADREVADADHRTAQPSAQIGPRGVVLAPPPRDRRVEGAQHVSSSRWLRVRAQATTRAR